MCSKPKHINNKCVFAQHHARLRTEICTYVCPSVANQKGAGFFYLDAHMKLAQMMGV